MIETKWSKRTCTTETTEMLNALPDIYLSGLECNARKWFLNIKKLPLIINLSLTGFNVQLTCTLIFEIFGPYF